MRLGIKVFVFGALLTGGDKPSLTHNRSTLKDAVGRFTRAQDTANWVGSEITFTSHDRMAR